MQTPNIIARIARGTQMVPNPLGWMLDVGAALLVLAAALLIAYEALAIISISVPIFHGLPTITAIVRPWVAANRGWFVLIAVVVFAALVWLFFHFYSYEV